MRESDAETLFFFDAHPDAFPIYDHFEEKLYAAFPETKKRVQKTQITFFNRHVFACVSFLRVRKKAELSEPYIVITLGLPYPLENKRAAVKSEPYPGRWTTHIPVSSIDELDDELFDWVGQAYTFSENK